MPRAKLPQRYGDNDDELLVDFSAIPTVVKTESMEKPDETRKALVALAHQGLVARASRAEIKAVLDAVTPGNWNEDKGKKTYYR